MGNACSQSANCTVGFDSTNTTVLALGGVKRGSFEAEPDIAGIGTVAALAAGSAVGLLVALIITVGLALDRIPKLVEFSYNHPVVRTFVPSPNQLLPRKDWPGTRTTAQPSTATSSSVELINNPQHFTHPSPPGHLDYDHRYPTYQGAPGPSIGTHGPPQPRPQRRPRRPPYRQPYQIINETSDPRPPDNTRPSLRKSIRPKETNYHTRNSFPERSYDVLEAILFCIHDSQLLLAIALGLSFHLGTNCSTSQYHLDIAMNLSIIGCISFLLAFTLVRNYWAAPIASAIRIACFGAVLYFIALTTTNQLNAGLSPEYQPPSSRNDSLILLEAVCFLNKTYSNDLNRTIGDQTGLVGRLGEDIPFMSYHKSIWVVGIASLVSALFRLGQFFRYGTDGPARKTRSPGSVKSIDFWSCVLVFWWFVTWSGCLWVYIWTVHHVLSIREWVSNSGWIESDDFSSNPENDIRSFGQIAAIVASGSIAIAAFDRWKPGWWKTWSD
ncbi:hypothetical protein FALBO_11554 [Fusarium albosuccineum]|uniref:Uncharacterized protein n=1 Tax=Fusarium albosuccineum TaxID=1237068 RepID=A0A8H4P9Z5_9HYPO|nr:hypothetical protein FALBO_11554 [Fusarium albosuccineum]